MLRVGKVNTVDYEDLTKHLLEKYGIHFNMQECFLMSNGSNYDVSVSYSDVLSEDTRETINNYKQCCGLNPALVYVDGEDGIDTRGNGCECKDDIVEALFKMMEVEGDIEIGEYMILVDW